MSLTIAVASLALFPTSPQALSPLEIAQKADQALDDLRSFSCDVVLIRQTEPVAGGDKTVDSSDRVKIVAERHTGQDVMGWKVRLTGKGEGGRPVLLAGEYAYDGGTEISILHASKTASIITGSQERDLFPLVFPGFFKRRTPQGKLRESPFTQFVQSGPTIEPLSRTKIAGVECVGVRKIETPQPQAGLASQRSDLFFGAEDFILRRYEVTAVIGGTRYNQVLSLENLQINPLVPVATFSPIPPAGYKVSRGTYAELVEEQERQEEEARRVAEESAKLLAIGSVPLDFSLNGTNGKTTTLSSLKGKVVLIDFFGTWCAPCNLAMPSHQKLFKEFGGKGLALLGISCSEAEGVDVAKYVKNRGYTYPVLLKGDATADRYKVASYPTVILLDRDGKIAYVARGHSKEIERAIESKVEELLGMPRSSRGTRPPSDE